MLILKNNNRVSFTVRLNLNNPQHQIAYERLRSGSGSYTATIVDALTKETNPPAVSLDMEALTAVLRQVVSEALREQPLQPVSASVESSGKGEISDEDFDVADDFMSTLCG